MDKSKKQRCSTWRDGGGVREEANPIRKITLFLKRGDLQDDVRCQGGDGWEVREVRHPRVGDASVKTSVKAEVITSWEKCSVSLKRHQSTPTV